MDTFVCTHTHTLQYIHIVHSVLGGDGLLSNTDLIPSKGVIFWLNSSILMHTHHAHGSPAVCQLSITPHICCMPQLQPPQHRILWLIFLSGTSSFSHSDSTHAHTKSSACTRASKYINTYVHT